MPELGEEDASKAYVSSPAGLADRYLLSRLDVESVVFITVLVVCFAIVLMDDWQGKLSDVGSIYFLLAKIGAVFVITLFVGACFLLFKWISKMIS